MKQLYSKAGLYLVVTIVVMFVVSCEKERAPAPQPWTYESDKAPYSVTMPPDWQAEDPAQFNSFADFAARKGQLNMLVIPQRLPRLAGAAPPDALALKRAAVSVMDQNIADLEISRQGPIKVSGLDGHTVFATGTVDKQPFYYITTYVTSDDWGFQIVSWAPAARERALTAEVDGLLDNWTFRTTESETEPPPAESDAVDADLIDGGE